MKLVPALIFGLAATAAFAHDGVKNEEVLARMDGMSDIAARMKLVGTMAKGGVEFDAQALDAALQEISAAAAQIPVLFEAEVTTPKSEAKPEVWSDFEGFTELAGDLESTALDLVGHVGSPEDAQVALQELGATCRACHGTYRE